MASATTKPPSPFDNQEILFQHATANAANPGAVHAEFGASISCADVDNDGDIGNTVQGPTHFLPDNVHPA